MTAGTSLKETTHHNPSVKGEGGNQLADPELVKTPPSNETVKTPEGTPPQHRDTVESGEEAEPSEEIEEEEKVETENTENEEVIDLDTDLDLDAEQSASDTQTEAEDSDRGYKRATRASAMKQTGYYKQLTQGRPTPMLSQWKSLQRKQGDKKAKPDKKPPSLDKPPKTKPSKEPTTTPAPNQGEPSNDHTKPKETSKEPTKKDTAAMTDSPTEPDREQAIRSYQRDLALEIGKNKEAHRQNKNLQKEIEELKSELKKEKGLRVMHQGLYETVKKEQNTSKTRINSLKEENDKLKKENDNLRKRLTQAEKINEVMVEKIAGAEAETITEEPTPPVPQKPSALIIADSNRNAICDDLRSDWDWYLEDSVYTLGQLEYYLRNHLPDEGLQAFDTVITSLGTNDIRKGKTASECHTKIIETTNIIREKTSAPILVVQPPPLNIENVESISEMRILQKKLEKDNNIPTSSTAILVTKQPLESLEEEYTTEDGYHLNEAGGRVVASVINAAMPDHEPLPAPAQKVPNKKTPGKEPSKDPSKEPKPTNTPEPMNTRIETERVEVSNDMLGHVIGKDGRGLNMYRNSYNVRAYVSEWDDKGTKRKGVIVSGEKSAVRKTINDIEKVVVDRMKNIADDKEAKERRAKIPCWFHTEFGDCRWGSECQYKHGERKSRDKHRNPSRRETSRPREEREPREPRHNDRERSTHRHHNRESSTHRQDDRERYQPSNNHGRSQGRERSSGRESPAHRPSFKRLRRR